MGKFDAVFEHLANAYDVAQAAGDGAAMRCHGEAIEALREAVQSAEDEAELALDELHSVTGWDDLQADAIGVAELAMTRILETVGK